MHKKELIKGLRSKLLKIQGQINGHNDHWWSLGQKAFAEFFRNYLEKLSIPHDEKYDSWMIEHYLPELAVAAFEKLRTGTDEETVRFREQYESETGHEIPNITDLGESSILHQGSAVQTTLGFMLKDITGCDWLESKIDAYCNAQKYVLQQTADKFLRRVYWNGTYEMVDKCKSRGMSGKFGETELRTYICGGRIMFTFARRKKGETIFRGVRMGKNFVCLITKTACHL